MFEEILVPLDGSELAEKALAPALELKQKFGSTLILLRCVDSLSQHLISPPGLLESPAAAIAEVELLEEVVEAAEDDAEAYLNGLKAKYGADLEAIVEEGPPAEAIVTLARDREVDLIVMSTHGRGGFGRLVFGSVADEVLKDSPVPVLLLRSREDEDDDKR